MRTARAGTGGDRRGPERCRVRWRLPGLLLGGLSSGFCRSKARTRLPRTLAAGCSQPKRRTRGKPARQDVLEEAADELERLQIDEAGLPVVLSR